MADIKSPDEPTLPAKRKPDLSADNPEIHPLKSKKLLAEDEAQANQHNQNKDTPDTVEVKSGKEALSTDALEEEVEEEENGEDDYEEDGEDEEEANGGAHVDRKGKGILIEEENDSDEDSDSDSSDGGNESDGAESDLSDDPLAEVDLDNILPSRTRRRTVQPGVYIANDVKNEDGSDDSDDSDA